MTSKTCNGIRLRSVGDDNTGVSPVQVNIGADYGRNHLPEPSREDVLALIVELEKFTIVKQKSNLSRLLK